MQLAEQLADFQPRCLDGPHKRHGVGAVFALAIKGKGAFTRRQRHHRIAARFHPRQTKTDAAIAVDLRQAGGKGIVAAGVDDHQTQHTRL